MKIKKEQLDRLASLLVASYKAKELMVTKAADNEVKAKIVGIIGQNFAEEEAIEEEARKVLASYDSAARYMVVRYELMQIIQGGDEKASKIAIFHALISMSVE